MSGSCRIPANSGHWSASGPRRPRDDRNAAMPLILLQPDQLPRRERELRAAPAGPGHRMLASRLSGGRASGDTLEALRILPPALNGAVLPGPRAGHPLPEVTYTY